MEDLNNQKQIDGIKKADPEELKKSRELVLSSIGEKHSEKNTYSETKDNISERPPRKSIDGISSSKINNKPDTAKPPVSKNINNTKIIKNGPNVFKNKIKSSVPKKNEIFPRKNIAKNIEKLKERSTEIKTVKRIPENIPIIEKEDFRKTLSRLLPSFSQILKKSASIAILMISAFTFLFLLISFLALNYGDRVRYLSLIADRLYVPAIVSGDGIIGFSEYMRIKNDALANSGNTNSLNQDLAKIFIINRLYKIHNTNDIKTIENNFAFDTSANIAPYNRIKKIRSLINNEEDFTKTAMKYGEVGQATISPENADSYEFGSKIENLKKNETSEIITTSKGYYIVHCFEKEKNTLTLSYVFIPALTLNQYLEEELINYRFWKLVKF